MRKLNSKLNLRLTEKQLNELLSALYQRRHELESVALLSPVDLSAEKHLATIEEIISEALNLLRENDEALQQSAVNPHPGVHARERAEELNLKPEQVATASGLALSYIEGLWDERANIVEATARRLAPVLKLPVSRLMAWQSEYELGVALRS